MFLSSQDIRTLENKSFQKLLHRIEKDILPYINDKTTMGQDILNLFLQHSTNMLGNLTKSSFYPRSYCKIYV